MKPTAHSGTNAINHPGSRYFLLCFSDLVPVAPDPDASAKTRDISQAYFEPAFMTELVPAWFAQIVRIPDPAD
jgi:hypothetical protein